MGDAVVRNKGRPRPHSGFQKPALAVAIVLLGTTAAACSSTATSLAHAGSPTTRSPRTPTSQTTATSSASAAGHLRAVVCVPGEQYWTTVDVTTRTVSQAPFGGQAAWLSGCDRYDVGTAAANNPPVAGLFVLSPNQQDVSEWMEANSGQDAGYQPADSTELQDPSAFVDASGNSPNGFAQSSVTDSQVIFNPATGRLWWQDQGNQDMYSNSVPPGKPVNQGRGYLYMFTPSGKPMPLPYYDSPDGTMRAVLSQDGYGQLQIYVGATSSLTAMCLQNAVAAESANGGQLATGFCGASEVSDASGNTGSSSACGTFIGWANSATVACVSADNNAIDTFAISHSGRLGQPTDLIPATSQTVEDALVTPDGSQVLFFLKGNQGINLYLVATNGRAAANTPTPLATWSLASDQFEGILGWILPNGQWEV
jgi:hypothetical protein